MSPRILKKYLLHENNNELYVSHSRDLYGDSLWPLTFATSCCGIEYMAVGVARYDFARFGFEVTRTITHKMAPVLRRPYDQMADPKYVVAVGGCAISGGPFKKSYHVVNGIDSILPC